MPTHTIGPLVAPVALAVDPIGNLYVLDADTTGPGEHINEYDTGEIAPR